MKHIVSIVEDKNAELLQDNSHLSQHIHDLEASKTDSTSKTKFINDLIAELNALKVFP